VFLSFFSLLSGAVVLYAVLFVFSANPQWARTAGVFGGLALIGAAMMFARHGSGSAQERTGRAVMLVCVAIFLFLTISNTVVPELLRSR
jgi:hypothetical protein